MFAESQRCETWTVMCYCSRNRNSTTRTPTNYWLNTSGNYVLKRFLERMETMTERKMLTRTEMEQLAGKRAMRKGQVFSA